VLLVAAAMGASLAGCNNKVLDPTQIGRFRPTPAVNVILDSLGVAEEPAVAWEAAGEPRPDDIRAVKTDYVLQPADVVRVSVFELLQEGTVLVNDYIVSETGKLSIPEVGVIQAAGLTETQLEAEIRRTLSPNILREPSVTVTLLTSQQRAFAILGNGVPAPGRYFIPRYDYRLMDALATAQVQMQFNVSHVYVSRKEGAAEDRSVDRRESGRVPELEMIQPGSPRGQRLPGDPAVRAPKRDIPEPSEPAQKYESEREMLDLISPQARAAWPQSGKVIGGSTQTSPANNDVTASMLEGGFRVLVPMKTQGTKKVLSQGIVQSPVEFGAVYSPSVQSPGEQRMEWIFDGEKWKQVPAGNGAGATVQPPAAQTRTQTQPQTGPETEWVLRDGNWVQVPRGQGQVSPARPPTVVEPSRPTPPLPLDGAAPPIDLEWDHAIQTRAIRIPTDRLLAGDPRYNLIIKPGDTIHVPVDQIGEFFIMGNVNRTGVINLTGRPLTLKQAIAAAGGLGPLAMPRRVEVIRRIGMKREEIVMVDLDKIASGEQPDFFVKPNDLINVGTDATSRFRAVLRNAFRAAYGFGFVYDRNFADADFGKGFQLPHWF
jgi:polysaccharide export outer membrane protein